MIAAGLGAVPLVVMEPNAIPGLTIRRMAKRVYRALVGFESTKSWFPPMKSEVTGVPVRPAFFHVRAKQNGKFTILVTGGSRGAHSLNQASRASWRFLRESGAAVRIVHQAGAREHESLAAEFAGTGLDGEVVPFIPNMADAFAGADLVVARSGSTVNEIAAAGMPSILVPFPFAADNHQQRNAEMLVEAGAARMILDRDLSGERLFKETEELQARREELSLMRERVRQFARPHAAERAAEVLEEAAALTKVRD
jgi:UDP-N-acetylglucosamine--N-acetylmuramyl-(pentapeptide) pyrophosphoryl-undecaprenol N-acetylglucosamine transferase